jgi:hypothetical protein
VNGFLNGDMPKLPQRIPGATLTPEYQAELDEPIPYVLYDGVTAYECREQGCDFQIYAVGPNAAPAYIDEMRDEIDEHERKHIGTRAGWIADVPSLVELDRHEAAKERAEQWERVMDAALEWEYADAYPDSPAAADATEALDALRVAVRTYREAEAARTGVAR